MTLHPPIGCFGGTFNPPHTAHFALVHSAREQLNLSKVLMIPAGQPWQKPQVLPASQRVAMLRLAIDYDQSVWPKRSPYPLTLDTLEADLPSASYTINTLKTLRAQNPDTPLVWIMGSDQLKNLHTWHDWQDLLDYAHIAVAQRAGHIVARHELPDALQKIYSERVTSNMTQWRAQLSGHFIPFTLTALHVSSSAIRHAIAHGQNPRDIKQLRPAVADYIIEHHLYKESL